ncbi:MAG TPA: DUF4105 domain-containing protein [Longimicrobiales bacterium]
MKLLRVLLLVLLSAGALRAQEPGSELRVFLMTLGPGDAVWERFGHNAIVVEDARVGYSIAYNWGMFDFDQPGYVPRLMKGQMMYWMAGYDTQAFANVYVQSNRSIWLQELNLTPQQKIAMRDFVEWNAQESNKFYRYDYYRDNCSTRVRDAIDRALGGQLATSLRSKPTDATYRSQTQRLTYIDPLTYTGLQLAMGNPIEDPLTAWEESFIPMELRDWVRQVQVRAANGQMVPLVTREVTMFEAQREPLAESPPNLIIWYLLIGLLLGGALLLLARGTLSGARLLVLAAVISLWSFVVGFFGLLISLLWALTDHWPTYYNENILQANVLSLVLSGFAVTALLRARGQRTAMRLALVIAGLSVLGFMLQVFPRLDQVNGEIIALFMPVHIAIAYILSSPRKTVTA